MKKENSVKNGRGLESELRRKLKAVTNENEMAAVRGWFINQMVSNPAYQNLCFDKLSPFEQWFAEEVFQAYQAYNAARERALDVDNDSRSDRKRRR
jgi:hypothetical protein